MRIAVFDLGSNTTKMLLAEVGEDSSLRVIGEETRPCRLTPGTDGFSGPAMEKCLQVTGELLALAKDGSAQKMKAVATESFRRASNGSELASLIHDKLGLSLSILSGEEEAEAIATGLLSDPALLGLRDFHAIDLGGGSMEVIAVRHRSVVSVESLPVGAVALSKRFCPSSAFEWPELIRRQAKDYLSSLFADSVSPALASPCPCLVGAGGTLVFLRRILAAEAGDDEAESRLPLTEVDRLLDSMAMMKPEARSEAYPVLPVERADVFPAGLLVLSEIMRCLGRPEIIHSYRNLRHGLAREMANQAEGELDRD